MYLNKGIDMVADLLYNRKKETDAKAAEDLAKGVEQLDVSDKKGKGKAVDDEGSAIQKPKKAHLSSLEMHDAAHYTTRSREPVSKEEHDRLDHTILYCAIAGYLFDCKKNKGVVVDDEWLQGVWDWVASKL